MVLSLRERGSHWWGSWNCGVGIRKNGDNVSVQIEGLKIVVEIGNIRIAK